MTNTFDVRIESLAYGGDALGRLPDGRVVFVPYAIPGELVRLRLVEEKAHHATATLVEVLEPSPERVIPRCIHFSTCGGCHYQHIQYPAQVRAKATILKDQLERIGGLREIPAVDIYESPKPWNYRNTIQFHITREGKLGFQKARSNQPFAIRECHLPEETINWLWPQIEVEPIASLERVSLRVGSDEEMMLILESSEPQAMEFSIEELPVSIVQLGDYDSIILAGSDYLSMGLQGRQFKVSASSFFQVNTLQAEAIVSYLSEHLPISSEMTVVDAYCGVGLFSAFLAPKVRRLVGIEVSPSACEDFSTNLDEFEQVELYEAPVEDVLGSIHFQADTIILDPPRAGLGAKTVEGVLGQGAAHLAYVSCDPATLARDGRQLAAGGYALTKLALFDMFPQTYHIESISLWNKKE
jgi:23S rRNA (uracil1939-C5)-methyltransferase